MDGPKYRFSGHETFPCRYAWLPKAVEALKEDDLIFSKVDQAMVQLGLGKNMVQALRFWAKAMRVAANSKGNALAVTEFGERIFCSGGFDPYMEDATTLWLLHWQLCSHDDNPLFAWEFLFNRFNEPEIVKSKVLEAIDRESQQLKRPLAKATLENHFSVFMHTYVPTRGKKSSILEDSLDCPLVELELIQTIGQRISKDNKAEPAFAFRREAKTDLSPGVFMFAVQDFWHRVRPNSSQLSLHDLATASGSPGQVFKLPEDDIRERLTRIGEQSDGVFEYSESAMFEQLTRTVSDEEMMELDTLDFAYEGIAAHA